LTTATGVIVGSASLGSPTGTVMVTLPPVLTLTTTVVRPLVGR
jgi:hypothetical protein